MAKIKYTPSQYRAVTYPDGNLLLSAAAGSGKTAALTGRIVQLIIEGRAELSDMLIVTFTKAAAGEMKGRINKILREKIEEYRGGDMQVLSRLTGALSQVPSAQICTIHAFLYQALRPYFPVLNLSQDARIGDEKEIETMKKTIMADVVDDCFSRPAGESEDFVALADAIGQARDSSAVDAELLWLAEKLDNMGAEVETLGFFADALATMAETKQDPFETPYGDVLLEQIRAFVVHYEKVFEALGEDMESEPVTMEKYGPALDGICLWLQTLRERSAQNPRYSSLKAHFDGYEPVKLGTITAKNATETSLAFKKVREELKKDIAKLRDSCFADTEEAFYQAAEKTARILYTAKEVIGDYKARLKAKKQSLSLLEYGDLERYATGLFLDEAGHPTAAAREIGQRYRYIFVDEYQDTNGVQDRIFCAVSEHAVRFMVGDIKQSIYRFRGADPRVFSSYRRAWQKAEMGEEKKEIVFSPEGGEALFMSENFRCSGDIIRLINAVSAGILPYGGIPYEKEDALVYGRGEEGPTMPAEIVLIDKKMEPDEAEEGDASPDTANPEAVYVARRISAMLGRYAEDSGRVITPDQVAILLRSPSSSAEDYRLELEKRGIPAKTKTVKPLASHPAVLLLVSLLYCIDNPLQDMYAAGVMNSSLFGFTVENLVRLRRMAGDLPLYTAVVSLAGEEAASGAEPESLKCRRMADFLAEQKTLLSGVSVGKYLENLLGSTRFWSLAEVRSTGGEREAVEELLSLALAFDKSGSYTGNQSLHAFLEYLEEYLNSPRETGDSEKGNAVSILSIHASKGLEYPVCFLCECAKKRNDKDEKRTVLFDDELGFGMQLPDETGLVKCDNLLRRAISLKIARQSAEEEMRMLYVALTRAQSKLIVTAKVDHAEKWLEEKTHSAAFADGYTVFRNDTYIDWIAAGIAAVGSHPSWTVQIENPAAWEDRENSPSAGSDGAAAADEDAARRIESRFAYSYPQAYLERIPAKLVVSRLEPEILDEESRAEPIFASWNGEAEAEQTKKPRRRPDFMKEGGRAAASEIGTATHRFLQFADYGHLEKEGVEAEMRRLTEKKFISSGDAALVSRKQIEAFVRSELFRALSESPMVKREFRFNVRMDAADFTAEEDLRETLAENAVKITVQGVVDCVYRHPVTGKLILVDYKTDSLRAEDWQNVPAAEKRMADRHRNQLLYYKEICSRLFEEPIEQASIYSTVLGRTIAVE